LPLNLSTLLSQLPGKLQILQLVALLLQKPGRRQCKCKCSVCPLLAIALAALATIYPPLLFDSFTVAFVGLETIPTNFAQAAALLPFLVFTGLSSSVNVL